MNFADTINDYRIIEARRQMLDYTRELVESGEMTRAQADAHANEWMAEIEDRILGGDR